MEMDLFGMCRVCLNDSRAHSNVFEVLLSEIYLYEVLNDVCQLEVKSDDGLPQFLCCECYQKLAMFDSFKRLSHKGSATLQSLKNDMEKVQVKVEPDFYESDYNEEESIEFDAKQCLEEVIIKNEPEDSLHFEQNGRDEWHGLDNQNCVKNEEETIVGEGFSAVQTELYLLPVKTEVAETFPAAEPTDPLKDEFNAQLEDPLHIDEDESTCDWYSEGMVDSPGENLGVRVNAEQITKGSKRLGNVGMVCDRARNNGSKSINDGRDKLGMLSLADVKNPGQTVLNNIKERQRVDCEESSMDLKSDTRNDRLDEFDSVEGSDVPLSGITTCINSKRSESEKVINHEEEIQSGNDFIGECSRVCLNCNVCGQVCVGEKDFLDHSKLHYLPDDNGSKMEDSCGTSEANHSGTEDRLQASKIFECSICGEKFSQKIDLKRHLHVHSGDKRFKCAWCDRAFTQFYGLRKHERIHTLETPFKCNFCDEEFHLESRLRKHLAIHTGQKLFQCDWCEKSYHHISQLKRHETLHTGEKAFKCSYCEKAFVSSYNLRKHEVEHISEKNLECKFCGRKFAHALNLSDHERKHLRKRGKREKKYGCQMCDKMFTTPSVLRQHEKVHNSEKPYKCSTCDKMFTTSSDLRKHEMVHNSEKPYKCSTCDKAFLQISKLKRHSVVHSGVKALKCKWCSKAFAESSGLSRHQKTHSGDRPYSCAKCDKTFSMKAYLKAHMLLHTDKKLYKCDSCPKTFSNRFNLKRHEAVHSDDTLCPEEVVETQYLNTT